MRLRAFIFILVAAAACTVQPGAWAYPDKPVQYIIAFSPGGESDVMARWQQIVFRKLYNKDMVILNKPGAGGGLAWSQLNSQPADGHTIVGINLPHIVLQPMEGQVQYKTEDITPVYWFHYTADAIIVPIDSPYKTFADLVKAAKAAPGKLTFAGSGTNSANHLAHEKFNILAGVTSTYVPFKGTGDLMASVAGNHVSGAMSYVPLAIQQKGKMRLLAVALNKRHPQFPDVPTFKELGFNWVDGAYRGVGVPKSTPMDVQKKVSDMMAALNKDPGILKQMADGGFEVVDIPVDKNAAFMQARTKEYVEMAKRMGLVK